jgi:hypothetical protein
MSLFTISLFPAIAGGGLAYLMVMSFLNFADRSTGSLKGLAGLALLLGCVLALMPIGILVAGPKSKKSAGGAAPSTGDSIAEDAASISDEEIDELQSADDFEAVADDDFESADGFEDDLGDDLDSGELVAEVDSGDLDSGDFSSGDLVVDDESDEFNSDDLEIPPDGSDDILVAEASDDFGFDDFLVEEDDDEPEPPSKKKKK